MVNDILSSIDPAVRVFNYYLINFLYIIKLLPTKLSVLLLNVLNLIKLHQLLLVDLTLHLSMDLLCLQVLSLSTGQIRVSDFHSQVH